jgi:hypothetical protein
MKCNCPVCSEEMHQHSKKQYFWTMFIVALFIWPMFLFLPFMGLVPRVYTCRKCKKSYKEKDLIKQALKA